MHAAADGLLLHLARVRMCVLARARGMFRLGLRVSGGPATGCTGIEVVCGDGASLILKLAVAVAGWSIYKNRYAYICFACCSCTWARKSAAQTELLQHTLQLSNCHDLYHSAQICCMDMDQAGIEHTVH
eukprot:scaffold12705_cov106-Isochrysis_galbana.AAC.7